MDFPARLPILASLTTRLVQELEREPQAQAILRRVLANANIPTALPPSVFGWMARFPGLARVQRDVQNINGVSSCVPLVLGPLLAWSATQPWHEEVRWQHYLKAWPLAMLLGRRDHHALETMVLAWESMTPVWSQLPPDKQHLALAQWLDNDRVAPSWEAPWFTKEELPVRAQLWSILLDMAQGVPTASDACHTAFSRSLLNSSTWNQEALLVHILNGSLNPSDKCRIACAADACVLSTMPVQAALLPLLPPDEHERLALLPWVLPAGWPGKKSRLTYMNHEAIHANKATVQNYCPVLYASLANVVAKDDWLHPTRMRATVRAMTPGEPLPLPLDWEAA